MCSKFEQFREQTATIDGLVEWICDNPLDKWDYCIYTIDTCFSNDCKAGIKAYWEGEAT